MKWIFISLLLCCILQPANAYLSNVTVAHDSEPTDDRSVLTIGNSSFDPDPTWINATMQNATDTYTVKVDSTVAEYIAADSRGTVRYYYPGSWTTGHTFEFNWFSSTGVSAPPDPTDLTNTTGETWVRHSWNAGSGNVTDSYNVSVNTVWHNTSPAYYNNTGLLAESWSNVTVWAWNDTGGISQNSISQNTQSDAGDEIIASANQYTAFNDWDSDQTFSQIAALNPNDVCYSWYNHTSGLHEAYYAGRTYNADKIIPKNCSVFGFFDAETIITITPRSAITIPGATWFYGFLPGSSSMTLADIATSMDADGLDCWAVYRWDGATNNASGTVQPKEGITVYTNNTGEWTP